MLGNVLEVVWLHGLCLVVYVCGWWVLGWWFAGADIGLFGWLAWSLAVCLCLTVCFFVCACRVCFD